LYGRSFIKVLEEKNLPISEYVFFASSRSAGNKISFLGQEYEIGRASCRERVSSPV
jgi:aspartate-semialdehyde dehydrogenase